MKNNQKGESSKKGEKKAQKEREAVIAAVLREGGEIEPEDLAPRRDSSDSSEEGEQVDLGVEHDPKGKGIKVKKGRGRAKLKLDEDQMDVYFNERCQPIDTNSQPFSTFLGRLARERVPIIYDDWRNVDDDIKQRLWVIVKQRYTMKVDAYQYAMSKMGKSLRDERCNLTRALRKPKKGQTEDSIRPNYVSLDHWKQFVTQRKSKQFKDKSEKMKDVRSHQNIVHRTSRKGFARLEHEMKQNCTAEDPPVDRVSVWKKGYAPKDKPVSDQVAQYIEQMDQYSQSPAGQNPTGIDDDALTHVFGRERPGRVRGMGFGVTPSMLRTTIQSNRTNQVMREEIQELKQQVSGFGDLAERLRLMEAALASAGIQLGQTQSSSMPSANFSGQARQAGTEVPGGGSLENAECTLIHWIGDKIDVARGKISSTDPTSTVHHVPLGFGYYRVWVDEILVRDVALPRPTREFLTLDEAYGTTVAWPMDCIRIDG